MNNLFKVNFMIKVIILINQFNFIIMIFIMNNLFKINFILRLLF
jgi:hypothetical protein